MKAILRIAILSVSIFCLSYFFAKEKSYTTRPEESNVQEEEYVDETNSGEYSNYGARESNQETSSLNICQVCSGSFAGNGFTEVTHGNWQETQEPYQSFICSKSCGAIHTRNWETTLGKNQGKVYDREQCGLCEGTGIEINRSSMSDEYGRTCPQCNGKGYQSY